MPKKGIARPIKRRYQNPSKNLNADDINFIVADHESPEESSEAELDTKSKLAEESKRAAGRPPTRSKTAALAGKKRSVLDSALDDIAGVDQDEEKSEGDGSGDNIEEDMPPRKRARGRSTTKKPATSTIPEGKSAIKVQTKAADKTSTKFERKAAGKPGPKKAKSLSRPRAATAKMARASAEVDLPGYSSSNLTSARVADNGTQRTTGRTEHEIRDDEEESEIGDKPYASDNEAYDADGKPLR